MRTNARHFAAEFLGNDAPGRGGVGSGIMGERLAAGNIALAHLANTIATGAALIALILAFGPISGAHPNSAVTLANALDEACCGATCPLICWRSAGAELQTRLLRT